MDNRGQRDASGAGQGTPGANRTAQATGGANAGGQGTPGANRTAQATGGANAGGQGTPGANRTAQAAGGAGSAQAAGGGGQANASWLIEFSPESKSSQSHWLNQCVDQALAGSRIKQAVADGANPPNGCDQGNRSRRASRSSGGNQAAGGVQYVAGVEYICGRQIAGPRPCDPEELEHQIRALELEIQLMRSALDNGDALKLGKAKSLVEDANQNNKKAEELKQYLVNMDYTIMKLVKDYNKDKAELAMVHDTAQHEFRSMESEIGKLIAAANEERQRNAELVPLVADLKQTINAIPAKMAHLEQEQKNIKEEIERYYQSLTK